MTSVLQSGLPTAPSPTYTFTSQPRALLTNRKKYRNPPLQRADGTISYGNIMFDRRVVRGNTYAQQPVPTQTCSDIQAQRQQEAKRRALARRRAQPRQSISTSSRYDGCSPPPVDGRKHIDVQTEQYLEELALQNADKEAACQTDPFFDRPASPIFVPAKTGRDVETQIYPGDLFDFDLEVQPILEVLVGKTVEQALLEVLEEEELAALRAQQRRFEENRRADLAEQQRLEEQERRLREEKERRVVQREEAVHMQEETADRVAAAVMAQGYLADLLPSVLAGLKNNGFLHDVIQKDVEGGFMPWLLDQVREELQKMVTSKKVLADIIKDILEARANEFVEYQQKKVEDERLRKEQEEKDEEERQLKEAEGLLMEKEGKKAAEEGENKDLKSGDEEDVEEETENN